MTEKEMYDLMFNCNRFKPQEGEKYFTIEIFETSKEIGYMAKLHYWHGTEEEKNLLYEDEIYATRRLAEYKIHALEIENAELLKKMKRRPPQVGDVYFFSGYKGVEKAIYNDTKEDRIRFEIFNCYPDEAGAKAFEQRLKEWSDNYVRAGEYLHDKSRK